MIVVLKSQPELGRLGSFIILKEFSLPISPAPGASKPMMIQKCIVNSYTTKKHCAVVAKITLANVKQYLF